jgi:ubiquinone biosynthesis monooxygenase Coq6
MAYMTENTNLQRALLTQIERTGRGKIAIKENARVEEMRMSEGKRSVLLNLGGHGWVRGGVVVGADGPNSPVRAFSGIKSFGHSYPTHGIVATLNHRRMDTNNTAFQRFLPTGPLAFLPMSPTASTMVWSTRPELAAAYKAVGPEALCDLVNLGLYASEADLERLNVAILSQGVSPEMIRAESERIMQSLSAEDIKSLPPPIESIVHKSIASFPLKLSHAESYIGERTVLIGDAAHTVHPLAGQGLNMGLADVKALGETWEKTKKVGGDLGKHHHRSLGRFRNTHR